MLRFSPFPERRGNTALQNQYSKAEKEICKSQSFLLFVALTVCVCELRHMIAMVFGKATVFFIVVP
jgi:hypothetical protein